MEYPRQYHERERLIQGKIGSDVGQQWLIDLSKLDIQVCLNGQLWVKAFVKSSEDIGLRVISKYFHIYWIQVIFQYTRSRTEGRQL
jgi:hypothetical protein